MSSIRLKEQSAAQIPTPDPGYLILFMDSGDNGKPKVKDSTGSIVSLSDIGDPSEWRNSVNSVETDPSSLSPSTGDRFLVGNGAILDWVGRDGQIAQWDGTQYQYTEPTNGLTIKVDAEDDVLYHHEGDYSSGVFAWETKNFTGKYSESKSLSSGVASNFNHALDSQDIIVQAWESGSQITDELDINIVDNNNIEVTSSTSRTVKVVVRD